MFDYNTNQALINSKAAQAVHSLRTGFEMVNTYAAWLANQPVVNGADPLETIYGFSADEAYVLRTFFETMSQVSTTSQPAFELGQKITGLMN